MASTTATTTATVGPTTPATATQQSRLRNPKDSMKSTWRQADKKTWNFYHWFMEGLNMHPTETGREVPIHKKTDKVPAVPDWQPHVWVLAHSLFPMVVQQAITTATGKPLHPLVAFTGYYIVFQLIGIHQIQQMRRIGHKYGFLDGDKHERDQVPDVGVRQVFWSLFSTPTIRAMFAIMLSYNRAQQPYQLNWWALPIEIGLYGIILDFWFYWYHRVMHQFDSLWKYHRTHHLTKHPNPLLTLYADHEQEVFDIIGIPLLAYFTMKLMGLPMGFYEWWICQNYVVFTELAGHSGLRIMATPPSTLSWLLRYFESELAIEDHDLHHRSGWKKSHNYGKQTRLWDRVFGTCIDRIETPADNIDYVNTASIFVGMFPWSEKL